MRVYENRRTTSTGSTWQASAQNTTGSNKSITAFAYCLPGTKFTSGQTSLPVNEWGIALVMAHPKKVLGGGYYFPRTANYTPTDLYQYGWMIYVVNLAGVPSTGDPNARGYAETWCTRNGLRVTQGRGQPRGGSLGPFFLCVTAPRSAVATGESPIVAAA